MSWLVSKILSWLSGDVLGKVLGHLEARVNNETERQRIRALRDQHMATVQGRVIAAGMTYKWFWIPWLIATVPLSCWFAVGMIDTTLNGAGPDVARIPPHLIPWAKAAWDSLFFSGAGVASAQAISQAVSQAIRR